MYNGEDIEQNAGEADQDIEFRASLLASLREAESKCFAMSSCLKAGAATPQSDLESSGNEHYTTTMADVVATGPFHNSRSQAQSLHMLFDSLLTPHSINEAQPW